MKSQRATSGRRYIKIGLTVDFVHDTHEGKGVEREDEAKQ